MVSADRRLVASEVTTLATVCNTEGLTTLLGESAADAIDERPAATPADAAGLMVILPPAPPIEIDLNTLSAVAAPAALICETLLTSVFTASAAEASASGVVARAVAEFTRVSRPARVSAAAVALLLSNEPGSFIKLAIELTSATVAVASAAVSGLEALLLLMSVLMNVACAAALTNTCLATTTVKVAGRTDTPPSELRASTCTTTFPAGSSTPETLVLLLKSVRSVVDTAPSTETPVVKLNEYCSGVFASVQLAVVNVNGATSSVPLAADAARVPPVGTDMVATVALAVALPNASLTDSRKV